MVIWRLPIWQKSVRYRRVVSCAHSKGRLVFPSGATCSISESKSQSPSCCTRTTHYQQSRWKSDSLTSQLSIEASVRLLELRQDGGEEQTHRCRKRSPCPRLKRSEGRTRVSRPLEPNRNAKLRHFQSRQGLKLPKQWQASWSRRRPLTQFCLAT